VAGGACLPRHGHAAAGGDAAEGLVPKRNRNRNRNPNRNSDPNPKQVVTLLRGKAVTLPADLPASGRGLVGLALTTGAIPVIEPYP